MHIAKHNTNNLDLQPCQLNEMHDLADKWQRVFLKIHNGFDVVQGGDGRTGFISVRWNAEAAAHVLAYDYCRLRDKVDTYEQILTNFKAMPDRQQERNLPTTVKQLLF